MSEVIKNKYLDLVGLRKYDELIKGLIASGNKSLADAIAGLDAKIGSIDFEGSDEKNIATAINEIYASISEIVEKQDALDDKDIELEGKINGIIGDLESLEGSEADAVMTLVEIANKLNSIDASVSKNTQDIADVTGRVATLEGTIEDLKNLGGENGLVAVVDKVNANATAIEKLNGGADVEGSVKKAAAEAQAAAEATAAADATSKADAALASAKEYADDLVKDSDGKSLFDAVGSAAAAQAAAEAYADGLVKDAEGKSLFDEAGAAATAQAAAEATAAADATAKATAAETAAKGYADSLDTAMDERVKVLEAIDHEQLTADAVAAVVAGAESDFDTLKEVADWIASDKEGSAALQTTVSGHTESINTINSDIDALETKVDNDIANLTAHMSEAAAALADVDGRLDVLEAFEETHASINVTDIEGLFA